MAALRQRKQAVVDDVISDDEAAPESVPPRAWHASTMVRVILVALLLFVFLHFYLWKIVYDFAMDTNHERLRGSVMQAYDSLYTFLEHL